MKCKQTRIAANVQQQQQQQQQLDLRKKNVKTKRKKFWWKKNRKKFRLCSISFPSFHFVSYFAFTSGKLLRSLCFSTFFLLFSLSLFLVRWLILLLSQSIVLLILCSLHGIFFHFVRVYLALCYIEISFFALLCFFCASHFIFCVYHFSLLHHSDCVDQCFLLNGISMEDITIYECVSVCVKSLFGSEFNAIREEKISCTCT